MKIRTISILVLAGILALSCKGKKADPDPDYIAAVSGGILGRTESVKVVFNQGQDISRQLGSNAFVLSPAAKGIVSWEDEYTLVFTPTEALKPNQRYEAQIRLGNIPGFTFEFMTSAPYLSVNLDPVIIDESGNVFIRGIVNVEEDSLISQIEGTIYSPELGTALWDHENGMHRFSFHPVRRLEAPRTVSINWDGRSLGSSERGFTTVEIPGLNIFKMTSLSTDNGVITVSFSSSVRTYSDLRGFISLSGKTDVRYSLEGNIIRIFGDSSGGIPPGAELLIQDLEDVDGNYLITPVQYTVPDRWDLPAIRMPGTGTILPSSQGAQLVVETRNVSGLLIEAFHIYGDNMLQFLQVNNLDGTRELDRVGQPVWTKAVEFSWTGADQNRWISRGIDVSELSRKFPGGMFHIRVTFRQRHVHYECETVHGDFSHLTFPDDSFSSYATNTSEPSYWNNYSSSPGYNYSEWYRYRNDPCHPAFYTPSFNSGINLSRNVIVSNLGLIAKKSNDNSWLLATTNLLTARPSPNTNFSIYNFQGRLLYQGRTGVDGMARIPDFPEGSSASLRLIIYAENSLGRAYLKINNSLTLAVSHFDVSGSSPSTGVKGLIYGERGVWRPGDDIFLTFLLSDPQSSLPANHPVTLEFEDPRGRLVTSRTYTTSMDGFYPIAVSTTADAPTGDWIARVRVGGNVFTRTVKIETVMPNRLKMDLDFGSGEIIKSGPRQVSLEAAWLHGATAPGLKADISVTFVDRETAFSGYADYTFRDTTRTVSSERQTLWEGTLNGAGRADFTLNLNPGNAVPGKVTARFLTRVFEPSGVFSSEQISMEYSPYKRYAGLRTPRGDAARNMLLTDTDHRAEIVILNEDGNLVQESVAVNCAIYKLSWRWWWEMGALESAEFSSTLSRNPLSRATVNTVNGRASWTFRINYPDWGRYLIVIQDSEGGHAASQIVYIDWPGWAGRSLESGQGSQSMLSLNTEKSTYNVGERVSVSFPSNKDATALAIVEKGGEIVRREWIYCDEGVTTYSFSAEPSMLPNVYVHVTMLQPHLQAQNDLPIRLYGIVPVTIADTRVVLHPRITAAETWQAESRVSFTVSESEGRPMTYTVAVVDEGLLGLTRYNLPNPGNTFYAKEASFLKSWDLFQDVIGAYSGRLETLLAIGGGDDGIMDVNKETQRFTPVVRFFGPYQIGAGEQKTETFDLPPYIGALRIMVLAASSSNEARSNSQRAYGTAEASVKVNSDLMVFASLPRILSPDDEVEIPVYVNSYKDGNRSVRVSLSVPGATVQGSATQNVSFDRTGEQLIRFRVKAPSNPGQLRFTVTAESTGLVTARHETDIEVRSTAIPVTRSVYSLISPGETWRGNLDYPGRSGTNTLIMGFSRLPPLNLESRLQYLISYPHGCVEQTTSAAFPQLYLDKILDMDSERLAAIRTNINAGIERLSGMQVTSGGFAYWPGDQSAHDWASSYVGHFLLEAKKAGYTVRDSVIRNWVIYQKNVAAQWQARNGRYVEQAYRLYTLALAGEADLGSMNRLREQRDLPMQARWRLAAAYWYAGQRDTARNMVSTLSMPETEYRELSGTFGSSLRDKAMILETLVLLGGELGRTMALVQEISDALSSERWLSTQETAYALIAMAPYMQQNAQGGALSLDYTAAGRSGNVTFSNAFAETSLGSVTGSSGAYTFTNRSSYPVYVRLTARGLPEEGSEPSLSEGLALRVEYRDSNGREIDPKNLNPGQDMEVRVTVRNSYGQSVEEIALIIPIPASWEIINTRLTGATLPSAFRYQDIRDDRIMTYFNLNRNEEKTVSFVVNRTYNGSYFRPAIHAYAMYDESIRALIPGVKP
ncbi:MAG: alpha-2-macroglobulin [Treponema sp.]|jgi:uncharacterized protein YfaS (alpha-2-macroglobulin family)|nr:alpha-2-macroglobulin [Treponema sp.]